jgi:hypothetical protein
MFVPGEIASTKDVLKFLDSYKQKLQDAKRFNDEFYENEVRTRKQRENEEKIIMNTPACSINAMKALKTNISDLNVDKLAKLLNEQFYDAMVMKTILCITDSIFYTDNGNDAIPYNERIREWIRDLKQIGQESVEGIAMRASLKDPKEDPSHKLQNNIFVIKAPRNPNNMELLHEMFVGLQLNKLRSEIPNFAYVFGGFKCAPPIIDKKTKEVELWCSNTENVVNYVIYENIVPSISMDDFSKKCIFDQFCNRLFQLCYSIDLANKKFDFTHYDLHAGNVLNRTTNYDQFYIPYLTEKGVREYLLTDGIATIIDYGISHITYDGVGYGDYSRQDFQVFPDRSFPISDIYKFLLMNMRTMYFNRNDECFGKCRTLLAFFNNIESAEDILANQDAAFFYLPYNQVTSGIKIADFARYMRIVCEEYGVENFIHDVPQPGIKIMGCDDPEASGVCYTNLGIVKELGIDKFDFKAHDTLQFMELYSRVSKMDDPNVDKYLEKLKQNFNYYQKMDETGNRLEKLYTKADGILKSIKRYNISKLSLSYLLKDTTILEGYRKYLDDMIELLNLLKDRENLVKSLLFTAGVFEDQNGLNKSNDIDKLFKPIADFYNRSLYEIFRQNKQIESEIVKSWAMFRNEVAKNPELNWWYSGLQFFTMATATTM